MEAKFDMQHFISRTKLKQREVAERVGSTTGLIGIWAIGRAVPSYDKIVRLIEMGMTAQELFGEELGDLLVRQSEAKKPDIDNGQIMEAVKAALRDLSNGK